MPYTTSLVTQTNFNVKVTKVKIKSGVANFTKKIDFDTKLSSISNIVTSNKRNK